MSVNINLNKIASLILNPYWRYNNLYYIYDKWGQFRVLKMNYSQWYVERRTNHPRKVILKSRQQGISTYYLMRNLDYALTTKGVAVGIQSYGLDESSKLQNRVKIMLDNLDPIFYKIFDVKVVKSNSKEIVFSNDSTLKIGNFRGDTLQSLHISEYAKIAKKSPEKAKEIKTGAFQAIAVGNPISVESTAEGAVGEFHELWELAVRKYLAKTLTKMDFFPIFLSWLIDPDCTLDDSNAYITKEALEYVEQLKEKIPNLNLTKQQLQWLAVKLDELGDEFNREYPATPELAFKESVEGTYFKHQYKVMLRKRLISDYPYNPNYPVDVSYDLGINDEFVLLFSQLLPDNQPRIINEYHTTGESIEHIVNILKVYQDKYGYKYNRHFLPHDVRNRDLSTGLSRLELFHRLGVTKTVIVPKLSFQDSIQAARVFLTQVQVNEKGAPNLIKAIQNYRKKYDPKIQAYLPQDVHDIHSNYAAALRYLATGYGYHKITPPKPKIETRSKIQTPNYYNVGFG